MKNNPQISEVFDSVVKKFDINRKDGSDWVHNDMLDDASGYIDEKSENSGTASRVLNLRSTPTIAIMENSDVIKLKQSIYINEDLDYVAIWIISNLYFLYIYKKKKR